MKIKRRFIPTICIFIIFIFIFENITVKFVEAEENFKDDKKIIYLTFDDGPSTITNRVLEILKNENVKATFFLIGNQIKPNEDVVRKIYTQGHGIGLHTYTHKTSCIYSSYQAFVKEMEETANEIQRVVGIRPNIMRFPGGSWKRLNHENLLKLHKANYRIYDWNMVTSDGINPRTPVGKLIRQATGKKEKPSRIILLMHCDYTNKNTCEALPQIIKYYKNHNYEFKVITKDTKELYFPIYKK